MTRLALLLMFVALAPLCADDDVDRWIEQLGAAKPAMRDAAQHALTGAIDRALPALRAKSDDADAERKARVAHLLNVAGWLEDLAARRFSRREQASVKLKALGPAIIPALKRRLKHDDPEVRARSQSLLTALGWTSDAVGKKLDALFAVVRDGGDKPDRVFGRRYQLPKRDAALKEILELPTGPARLAKLFAERAGTLEGKIAIPQRLAVGGKPTEVSLTLLNAGKGGLWLRRPVSAIVRFESLQRHVRIERPSRRSSEMIFGGRMVVGGLLTSYAYLAAGRRVTFKRTISAAGFGRVVATLTVPAKAADEKGVRVAAANDLLIRPLARPFEAREQRYALPGLTPAQSGLELTLEQAVVGEQIAFLLRLTNKSKKALKILNISPGEPRGLWWLLRKGDDVAQHGWFDKLNKSRASKPKLALPKGSLKVLEPGEAHVVQLSVPRPEAEGRYRLQVGLGPISSAVGEEDIWVGSLLNQIEVAVKAK